MGEQRAFQRSELQARVVVTMNDREVVCRLRNLSAGGALVDFGEGATPSECREPTA